MRQFLFIFFVIVLPFGDAFAYEGERLVTRATDEQAEGTLRTILHAACDDAGDDIIRFAKTRLAEIRIVLNTPLVIPPDCNGKVEIEGSNEVETLLDASLLQGGEIPGSNCILHAYSHDDAISNFTFVGNQNGAGLCLFGRRNSVFNNKIGDGQKGNEAPNLYGVVVSNVFAGVDAELDGRDNRIFSNRITHNKADGLWVEAPKITIDHNQIIANGRNGIRLKSTEAVIAANRIQANGGCPEEELLASQTETCSDGMGGVGILVDDGAGQALIGGNLYASDKNTIQYNQKGGVFIVDPNNAQITVSHNQISKNYGAEPGLDLGGDGLTPNDADDVDEGPNHLLNTADYFQAFSLVPGLQNEDRYWSWGIALSASTLELYWVSTEDSSRKITHGGGDGWLLDEPVQEATFEILPDKLPPVESGARVSLLVFDEDRNTSEFSLNSEIGPDQDLDGIVDASETGKDPQSRGSDPAVTDSDGDGLPDSVEDKNRNGVWELPETCAYRSDSDGDNLLDWAETHGDGIYDQYVDTDPNNKDTDSDGLLDGEEDSNKNGKWEAYLGETNPLNSDSDGDGVLDAQDNCPSLYNPTQEPDFCFP